MVFCHDSDLCLFLYFVTMEVQVNFQEIHEVLNQNEYITSELTIILWVWALLKVWGHEIRSQSWFNYFSMTSDKGQIYRILVSSLSIPA